MVDPVRVLFDPASPNLATVVAGFDGAIAVTPRGAATHVVVDRLGYFY